MKKLLVLAVLMSGSLMAGERTILKDSKEFTVEVSEKTVLCSALGYGSEELKINIAALDGWTLLDHTNSRFGDNKGLPCMTAGLCKNRHGGWPENGFDLDEVLQNTPRKEKILVKREVIETRQKSVTGEGDQSFESCIRSLTEKLNTTVGGIKFAHQRTIQAETLPVESCK